MFEHEHPLNLIDLWSHNEKESDDDEDEDENDDLVTEPDFKCQCDRCEQEINWFHRYFYKCDHCLFSIHEFCEDLPATLEHPSHAHTLTLDQLEFSYICCVCGSDHAPGTFLYSCPLCFNCFDLQCVKSNIIHHPCHKHPLVRYIKPILCECDACGKEHEGIFYQCVTCLMPFIHTDCAFLSKKILIQQATNDNFSHTHPLTLAYSFPFSEQEAKNNPKCRVCSGSFEGDINIWIYKCEKCRYYAHIDCATSRGEPFMSIFMRPGMGKLLKNYEDDMHPMHLPFPDESYSLLRTLFCNEESGSTTTSLKTKKLHISHPHPLILVDLTSQSASSSSSTKNLSYHNPMKKIQLLCDGCVRPIINSPFYTCANECNFVLHEWCTRLPAVVEDHPGHPQHTLVYSPNVRDKFGVFSCNCCKLACNGFVYSCVKCRYHVDVNCAFIPKQITHEAHPNHLLSLRLVEETSHYDCRMCLERLSSVYGGKFSFSCQTCDIHLHANCALLLYQTITHKYDKHPMKLSYFPAENHEGEYFCEICEEELNPEKSFYHCNECVQSIHPACAPSILQSETNTGGQESVFGYLNIKFSGFYHNDENLHLHRPLLFAQGIVTDGRCAKCGDELQYKMIFKCQQCKFAIDYNCC